MLKHLFILVTFLASISAVGQNINYSDIMGKWYEVKHRDTVVDFYFHDTTLFYAMFPIHQLNYHLMVRYSYQLKQRESLMFLEFSEQDSSFKYYLLLHKLNNEEILIQGNNKMDSTILINPTNIDSKHKWRLTRYHEQPAPIEIGKPDNLN